MLFWGWVFPFVACPLTTVQDSSHRVPLSSVHWSNASQFQPYGVRAHSEFRHPRIVPLVLLSLASPPPLFSPLSLRRGPFTRRPRTTNLLHPRYAGTNSCPRNFLKSPPASRCTAAALWLPRSPPENRTDIWTVVSPAAHGSELQFPQGQLYR
ncbi:uncharacterized protein BO80DRAFT_233297 [Aspergillus ibericus CBS 121593]|uniref:Secreted protein n=1 Tax=Aspergillus ibericus CBS 121593 TaxID=1448316 RepID=A0A395H9M0_9EURO|nr:hypothetical protein BO80DRAFT_233297 [Aspergillus ibericus CBS 121593]RAL04326.1 hypothetical protein BO80DRAFT_233297 [Aspergillus ibericus CBS 121593]